jgi:hypothetical protein
MENRNYATLRDVIMMLVMSWLLVCAPSTKAAVQIVTFSEAPAFVNSFTEREIELPQFNSELGSLQSVTIDVKGTGAFVHGFNHWGGPGSHRELSGEPSLTLILEAGDGKKLVTLYQSGHHHRTFPGHQGGTDSTDGHVEAVNAMGRMTLGSNQELMQFTGCAFIDLFLSGRAGFGHGSLGGQSIQSGLWIAGADIRLTYQYTAVPENSTWLAAGFALLLLVLVGGSNAKTLSSAD